MYHITTQAEGFLYGTVRDRSVSCSNEGLRYDRRRDAHAPRGCAMGAELTGRVVGIGVLDKNLWFSLEK